MKTRNQILLEILKRKKPNINTSKPIYPDGYWEEFIINRNEKINESNNITKEDNK